MAIFEQKIRGSSISLSPCGTHTKHTEEGGREGWVGSREERGRSEGGNGKEGGKEGEGELIVGE